jgi:hypothetical protein
MIIYLYIKRHAITGLKYFGKTIQQNPFKYHGSGVIWNAHIKEHGKHIETLDIFGFDNQEAATEFALKFSKDYDIVESKEWANRKEENAKCGGGKLSEETKRKIGLAGKGRISPMKGKKFPPEFGKKISQANYKRSEETKLKMLSSRRARTDKPMLGKTHSEETKKRISISKQNQPGAFTGKTHSAETKLKMSIAAKNRKRSPHTV